MSKRNFKIAIAIVFLIAFTVLTWRLFNVSVFNTGKARSSVYGDGYSDINTISSAKYFLDSGFKQTAFLPVHDYYPTLIQTKAYTHYPAIPNILCGVYATLFNDISEWKLRIIPWTLALLFFMLMVYVIFTLTNNHLQTIIGASVLLLSNYFICWADNLHQHLYGELLKWLYFILLYFYFTQGAKSTKIFIALMFILILEVNISFEQPVYLGVLTLGFAIIYKHKIFTIETIFGFLAIVLGFILHVWQNAVYFDSWPLAMEDLKHAFLFRTSGVELAGQKAEAVFTWKESWQIPFNWFNRMERFYLFPGWFMLVPAYYALTQLKLNNIKLYQIIWATFFASIAWSLVMAQHGYIHIFTSKHFSIWYGLIAAVGLPIIWQKWVGYIKQKNILFSLIGGLLMLYGFAMMLTQQIYPVYYLYSFAF